MDEKQLYIVLVRSNTILSNLIHWITQDSYTHVALALDKNLEYMFSFGRRYTNNPFIGCFRREALNEGLYEAHNELPGMILEVSVSDAEYCKAVEMVEKFLLNHHYYKYNYMGLMVYLFGIGNYSKNSFFCAEFVYYVLHQCGVCDFGLPRNLVRPQDLLKINGRIIYQGDLKQYKRCTPAPYVDFKLSTLTG